MKHCPPSILIVEDEALLLLCVADDLRDAGFHVLEASNADQAVKLLEANDDIRILFTDVDMPGSMDGLSLSMLVADRWPPIKIMVTSGKAVPRTGLLPPDASFIPKPYEFTALTASLHKMLT